MLINTQALRNKILSLAVQGKLVPQNQADGTAEELFIQIQKEKQPLSGSLKKDTVIESLAKQGVRNFLTSENDNTKTVSGSLKKMRGQQSCPPYGVSVFFRQPETHKKRFIFSKKWVIISQFS